MNPGRNDRSQSPSPDPRAIGALVGLVAQERLEEAERETRALLARHREVGVLWKILGVVLLRQGRDALPALAKAAELLPTDAEAQGNLGVALHDLGRWREALPNLQRAVDLDPRLPEAHRHLGNTWSALGDFHQAIASYRQAVSVDVRDIDALNRLGNALRDIGERREAAAVYAQAVAIDPERAESHLNLGNALIENRRLGEAVTSLRRAVALAPQSALAHMSLGAALRMQGDTVAAEASCRAALALDPDHAEALTLLGELRADQGAFTEATALFERVTQLNPEAAFAHFALATNRKMTLADDTWLQGTQALLARPLPLRHEISLRYALGKYHDDVGQYVEAFGQYRRANDLTKRYGIRYDAGRLSASIDTLIARFDASWLRDAPMHGNRSERPLFVVGMPRSGTSLTEQILASHPAVFGAGELTFWQAALHRFFAQAQTARAMTLLPGMADEYLQRLAAASGAAAPNAERVVDKMPVNFMNLGLIHAAFPRARIIHVRRHPIDTCLSIYFQYFSYLHPYANDFGHLAHYYREYARLMAHWRGVLPPGTLLEVPYEALVTDQEGWTRRMLEFAGLAWDLKCMNFHETERIVITPSKWQVRQKIHSASAGRWRHYEPFLGPLQDLLKLPGVT
jgi:tetratricopeptide (TPR) repeat protein